MADPIEILTGRFGGDSIMALATVDEKGIPWVRTIDAIFYGDSFYTITNDRSGKMHQIRQNPVVAISGEWFSGHGRGESLGHIRREENGEMAARLRTAFAAWYDNGHTNEDDPDTIILRIRLTDGILFHEGACLQFRWMEEKKEE